MLGSTLTYSNSYGPNAIKDQILFEFEIRLDQFKTTSARNTLGSLDFLGYVGGIQAVLDGAFYKFGEYFSLTFLFAAFTSAMFIEKKKSQKINKNFN